MEQGNSLQSAVTVEWAFLTMGTWKWKQYNHLTIAHSKTTHKPTSYSMGYSVEKDSTINYSFNHTDVKACYLLLFKLPLFITALFVYFTKKKNRLQLK